MKLHLNKNSLRLLKSIGSYKSDADASLFNRRLQLVLKDIPKTKEICVQNEMLHELINAADSKNAELLKEITFLKRITIMATLSMCICFVGFIITVMG